MNSKLRGPLSGVCLFCLIAATPAVGADLDCRLDYDLAGWSLVYKKTTGTGVVSCENGEVLPVYISAKALGLTVGRWRIDDGRGSFTDVHSITDVLGTYAQASANAGVVKSGEVQVLTNGPVSLALAGGGEGVNLGVDIGAFRITQR